MILLEIYNRVIFETLKSRFEMLGGEEKPKEVNVTVGDFDGVTFHLSNPAEKDTTRIIVSIALSYWAQLQQHGVDEVLAREYGDLVTETEKGQSASLLVDLEKLPGAPEEVFRKVSLLKRNCFAAVFEKFFKLQQSGAPGREQAIINYRPQETMYVAAQKDRVTVVFSTLFTDDDDVIIGKVFLQEFKEGRKGNPGAPQVLFSHKEPPMELKDTAALTGDNVGYITFVLFPNHIAPAAAAKTIDVVHTFRDYLHYHLKCSKAYLHSRMRARTDALLKVLNRAKPESEAKEKKTITGKSFVRK